MLAVRSIGVIVVLTVLGLGLFITRLHFDEISLRPENIFETIKRPFSSPDIPGARPALRGSLSPQVYTLFEQVYAEPEPPKLDLEGVAALCAETTYKPDVYLQCDLSVGGMATLFAHLKSCIGLAIGLGTNFIIPTTPSRNHGVLNKWDSKEVPIGKWLDRDFFIERIQRACPHIKVALLDAKKQPILDIGKTVYLNPCDDDDQHEPLTCCTAFGAYGADDALKPWKARTEERLLDMINTRTEEEQGNMVLQMNGFGGFFNKSADAPTARRFIELSELIRTPKEIRGVLGSLLDALSESPGQLKQYYGVHFRAEQDALDEVKNGWHTPAEQLRRILIVSEQARDLLGHEEQEKEKLIYLACGEQDKVDLFRQTANELGWKVVDKWTIAAEFGGDALVDRINKLDFDHMAMIDSALLLVSDFFIGTGDSSFSYNIAHHRNPTGRYWGNMLEFETYEAGHYDDVVQARTHLFYSGERYNGYHCCG